MRAKKKKKWKMKKGVRDWSMGIKDTRLECKNVVLQNFNLPAPKSECKNVVLQLQHRNTRLSYSFQK